MHEPDFWTDSAEAMELTIEGNRLIAKEVGELLAHLWNRVSRAFTEVMHGLGQHQQLPPM